MIVQILGGLGLFLLGMVLLTDGLKAIAGVALRRILTRFIRGPLSGVGWGALVTALVQSSTATTLATVGFVSAGLLTFPQAIGVIFGANLGTTSTGWIVSQLGFKVSLGGISPPLVLAGVAMRLLTRGRLAHAGIALAGFGLLFIGIDTLQGGMAALSERMGPEHLPVAGAGGLGGRAALVGVGFLMTVLTQSSSAAMAATLAAVASGTVGLEQAAALIVGQNVGTTPKAVAAAIGASTAAKRTALAHVLFNVVTAGVAFAALPILLRGIVAAADGAGVHDVPTVLATFHTGFNLLGVAILLPLVRPFSRLIERIVPERALHSTRFLVPAVAEVGPVALEAARRAVAQVVAEAAHVGVRAIEGRYADARSTRTLTEAYAALREVRRFVHGLGRAVQGDEEVKRQASLLHASDHAARLIEALREPPANGGRGIPLDDPVVDRVAGLLSGTIAHLARACEAASAGTPRSDARRPAATLAAGVVDAEQTARQMAELRKAERRIALMEAAAGRLDPEAAMSRVDALLWLDRVVYHVWRASTHLVEPRDRTGDADQGAEAFGDAAPGS